MGNRLEEATYTTICPIRPYCAFLHNSPTIRYPARLLDPWCHVVKRRLFHYLGGVRGGSCGLILALLMLPYLVDVAYYGDLTPTHYAQENLVDGETDDLSDVQTSLLNVNDQEQSIETGITLQGTRTTYKSPVWGGLPPQYLFSAHHISRPPPAI